MIIMVLFLTTWLQSHAKLVGMTTAAVAAVGSAGVGLHNYNVSLVRRIDSIETRDVATDSAIVTKIDDIGVMLSETRCMVITHHSGEDPLECLKPIPPY